MTAADIIKNCEEYKRLHGIMALLDILADITECQAQAAGIEILDIDDDLDDLPIEYVTFQ